MIEDIYKVNYMRDRFSYVGTLRNAKIFNINDDIFYAYGQSIIKGKIIGVELPLDENPEYRYKVELPKEIVNAEIRKIEENPDLYSREYEVPKHLILTCDKIFNNVQEAKESAEKNLQHMFELQKQEIERYFSQFIKTK